MFIVTKDMFGTRLEGIDGRVGTLYDVLFDDQSWKVRHLIVSTERWFHGRRVLLEPEMVEGTDWSGRSGVARLTKEQVRQCPSVDTELPAARHKPPESAQVLVSEAYWIGALSASSGVQGDPHLRSTRLLAGLHIHCPDGRLGHVEDFVVDDQTWSVRYLVVDTRNWWPGKRVLIEPPFVTSIRWRDREIHLALTREQIERRPAYEGTLPFEEPVLGTA
jgi:sporulation protein YlmC with PRC-barrel domain